LSISSDYLATYGKQDWTAHLKGFSFCRSSAEVSNLLFLVCQHDITQSMMERWQCPDVWMSVGGSLKNFCANFMIFETILSGPFAAVKNPFLWQNLGHPNLYCQLTNHM
jgi:hypothetical protein